MFDDDALIIDPTANEEQLSNGKFSISLNSFDEICMLSKSGGCAVSSDLIQHAVGLAKMKSAEISKYVLSSATTTNKNSIF